MLCFMSIPYIFSDRIYFCYILPLTVENGKQLAGLIQYIASCFSFNVTVLGWIKIDQILLQLFLGTYNIGQK